MFPVSDDNSDRHSTPWVNYALLAINVFVFIFYQGMGTNLQFTYSFSAIPAEIVSGYDIVTNPVWVKDSLTGQVVEIPGLGISPKPVWLTLISAMFMHGGFAHLGGNMLYLWIFGDNIEDRLGHFRYLLFYLLCGIIASLTYVVTDYLFGANHLVPSLGASGAISAIMGAYMLLFPTKKVRLFVFFFLVRVPAFVVLGSWILLQVVDGNKGGESGIAYSAHIGGFIGGLLLVKLFHAKQKQPVKYFERVSRSAGK